MQLVQQPGLFGSGRRQLERCLAVCPAAEHALVRVLCGVLERGDGRCGGPPGDHDEVRLHGGEPLGLDGAVDLEGRAADPADGGAQGDVAVEGEGLAGADAVDGGRHQAQRARVGGEVQGAVEGVGPRDEAGEHVEVLQHLAHADLRPEGVGVRASEGGVAGEREKYARRRVRGGNRAFCLEDMVGG